MSPKDSSSNYHDTSSNTLDRNSLSNNNNNNHNGNNGNNTSNTNGNRRNQHNSHDLSPSSPTAMTMIGSAFKQAMSINNSHNEESLSSNEKDIEYVRVIYPYRAASSRDEQDLQTRRSASSRTSASLAELSVERNEILRIVEDLDPDTSSASCDQARLKVFNSQGQVGFIPSRCVEPIIMDAHTAAEFVFLRRPTVYGHLAFNPWYFGNVTRQEAVGLMNRYGRNGDYLVRDSDVRFLLLFRIMQNRRSKEFIN